MENVNLSQSIENYILELLNDEDENFITMRRKELAKMFECVPSQINYVIRSRFTPENGYLTQSRRGEHGYIKIFRIECRQPEEKISHIEDIIGDEISLREAHRFLKSLKDREFITDRERLLIEIALKNINKLSQEEFKRELTASLLKKMLGGLMLS